jgi:hypothetical protein
MEPLLPPARFGNIAARALGSSEFVATLERVTGRRLQPQKPGREPSERTEQLELRLPGIRSEGCAMGEVSP